MIEYFYDNFIGKGMPRTTQKTIAERLSLSTMAVSKAIRGHPDISPDTRKRVLEEARRLNYVPNLLARNLLRKQTKAVGFLFPDITHDFAARIVNGSKTVLADRDYWPLIGLTSWSRKQEEQEVRLMLGHLAEAIICQPLPGSEATLTT